MSAAQRGGKMVSTRVAHWVAPSANTSADEKVEQTAAKMAHWTAPATVSLRAVKKAVALAFESVVSLAVLMVCQLVEQRGCAKAA